VETKQIIEDKSDILDMTVEERKQLERPFADGVERKIITYLFKLKEYHDTQECLAAPKLIKNSDLNKTHAKIIEVCCDEESPMGMFAPINTTVHRITEKVDLLSRKGFQHTLIACARLKYKYFGLDLNTLHRWHLLD